MVVKNNQPALLSDIKRHFVHALGRERELCLAQTPASGLKSQQVRIVGDDGPGWVVGRSRTCEKGHGRIETRELQVLDMPHWMEWPGASQILRMERRTRELTSGAVRTETAYAITSLCSKEASPDQLQQVWRGHWGIENRSHWVRDVTWGEDQSTVRSGSIPQVMAALRNTVVSLLRVAGYQNIAAACRTFAYDSKRTLPLLTQMLTFE